MAGSVAQRVNSLNWTKVGLKAVEIDSLLKNAKTCLNWTKVGLKVPTSSEGNTTG